MKSQALWLLGLCFVSFALSQCTGTVNGTVWDLSPLTYDSTGPAPSNYQIQSASNGNTYYVNFCAAVSSSISADCNKGAPNGACQLSGTTYYGAGLLSQTTWQDFVPTGSYTQGVGIHYSNGVSCPNQPTSRNTIIYVACDENQSGDGQVVSETEDGCIYTLYFASPYGCPGGGGGSGGGVNPGWIIILICSVLFFVYVIVGAIIKFVNLKEEDLRSSQITTSGRIFLSYSRTVVFSLSKRLLVVKCVEVTVKSKTFK